MTRHDVTTDTGPRVEAALETGGRVLGVGTAVAGVAVLGWGWRAGDLVWLAAGVVLVLFGVTSVAVPTFAWELVVRLPFLLE